MTKNNNFKIPDGCQFQKFLGKLYTIITIKSKLLIFLRDRNTVILESIYTIR